MALIRTGGNTGASAELIGNFNGPDSGASTKSFNVSNRPDYTSLTVNDFIIKVSSVNSQGGGAGNATISLSPSYDNTTGVFRFTAYQASSGPNLTAYGSVYLLPGWLPN